MCLRSTLLPKGNELKFDRGWKVDTFWKSAPLIKNKEKNNNDLVEDTKDRGSRGKGNKNKMINTKESLWLLAIESNDVAKTEEILSEKPWLNINIYQEEGLCPWHIAVIKGNIQIIKLLLKSGADPNFPDLHNRQTSLHFAYQQISNEEVVHLLIQSNADQTAIDRNNKKPIDYEINTLTSGNMNSTYRDNVIIWENHLDSFMTSNREETSKLNTENNLITLVTNPDATSNANPENWFSDINTITPEAQQSRRMTDSLNRNSIEENEQININNWSLNDSLEDNELSYTKSKAYFISDCPLSSSKKSNVSSWKENEIAGENNETLYKKLIWNKRNCQKISYHCKNKSSNDNNIGVVTQLQSERRTSKANNNSIYFNESSSNNTYIHRTNYHGSTITFTPGLGDDKPGNNNVYGLISATEDQKHKAVNKNCRDKVNVNTNCNFGNFNDSEFSTRSQSNKYKMGYNLMNINDQRNTLSQINNASKNNCDIGRVSEFSLSGYNKNNINQDTVDTYHLKDHKYSKQIKAWLFALNLQMYTENFIANEASAHLNELIIAMKSYETRLEYADIENIFSIKLPGHIYRILLKLECDAFWIDDTITAFLLNNDMNKSKTFVKASDKKTVNLRISNEYICNCLNPSRYDYSKDLKTFLELKGWNKLYPNFKHNGFDCWEFVLWQMYSTFPISDDILENRLHIYDETDREKVLEAWVGEIKKINEFVCGSEYQNNPWKYHYSKLDLDKGIAKGQECGCVVV